MRRGLWILGVWLLAAPPLAAQILPIPPAPRDNLEAANSAIVSAPIHAVFEPLEGYGADALRFWTRCEYMLGRVRQTPVPLPLVTSGSTKDKVPGAIGQPNTVVLVGNASTGFGMISGMRLELGGWIDAQHILGIEASGFMQEKRVNQIAALSDTNTGTPLLALPFFNRTPGATGESGLVISSPNKIVGNVVVASSLQHWGADVNGIWCFFRRPGLELTLLAGGRYEDLVENLHSLATSTTLATQTIRTLDDRFATRNQFFGAQIGGSMHWQHDVLFFDVTSKVALGDTHQVVEIQGASTQTGPKASPAGSFPGGFFAQPSNIGRNTANPFAVLPALEMRLGYQITPSLRAFVGYDFLYWNQVVRPGAQIDRNINLTQSPLLGATHGVLSGPTAPVSLFNRTGFWAQDVNVGLELRF